MSAHEILKNRDTPAPLASGDELFKAKVAAEILASTQVHRAMAEYGGFFSVVFFLDLALEELRGIARTLERT